MQYKPRTQGKYEEVNKCVDGQNKPQFECECICVEIN